MNNFITAIITDCCGDDADVNVARGASPLGRAQRETDDYGDPIWFAYVDGEGEIGEYEDAADAVEAIARYCAPSGAPEPVIGWACDASARV